MARIFIRLGVICIAMGLAGCIVPIPQNHDIGRVIMVDPREIGVLTEQDVRDKWGQPAAIWDHPRIFVYKWDHVNWDYIWFIAGGTGGIGGDLGKSATRHMLLIEFDDAGRVNRAEHVQPTDADSYEHFDQYLKAWAEGMTDVKH